QQLKRARSGSAKGKKAKWFVEIERQTLQNSFSRLVKDKFQLDSNDQQTVHPPLFKLNKNKQSKDWIIFKNQRSGSWKLERIEKKKERKLLVEHWLERKKNSGKYLAVRYMHYALNKKGKKNNCITKIKQENIEIKKALKVKVSDRTEKRNKSKSTGQDKRLKENRNE
ncbi:16355_t:CDS:2, partial [Gigaspora margarita]